MERRSSLSLLSACLLLTCFTFGQNKAASKDAAEAQAISDAAAQGFPLRAVSNLTPDVSIEAVLLPYQICKRIFGKDIAKNYTAIELTISNRSRDAGLVVQSVYIDYDEWLLSGSARALEAAGFSNLAAPTAKTKAGEKWQAGTLPGQVASVEYRVARGELLDAQMWTARNWIIRSLQAAGSIASGYQFAFNERGIARGIASFNGQVVPAAQLLWPDGTINQLNRISDFGFQTNRLVPQQSADVLVAFFPIDRFLTPGLKKIFLKSPAAFFVPGAMLADPKVKQSLMEILTSMLGPDEVANLSLTKVVKDPNLTRILEGISLNKVRVMITGVLTANVATIPATIESVELEGESKNAAFWQTTGVEQRGVIKGLFLDGGELSIAEAEELGITNLTKVAESSTDKELHFTFTLTKPVPPGTHVHFQVVKQGPDKREVSSTKFDFVAGNAIPPQSTNEQKSPNQ
jgi:hypothetical protein